MGSRIAATVILVAGLAALLWVAVGGNDSEVAVEASAQSNAPADDAAADPADTQSVGTEAGSSDTTSESSESQPADTTEAVEATAVPPTPEPSIEEPENFGPRMDLVNLDGWLNTDATSIDDFNGQVLLVEMWTFGCHNCKARIPFNQSYYEEFQDENFEIIGVHAPEFSFEADVDNIKNAIVDLGVSWPVALDTNKKNFRAWQPGSTNFWPRTYVIDQNGDIRYDHIGEGRYEELRETVRYLIENPPAPATAP